MSGNRIFSDTNIILYFLNGDSEVIEILKEKEIIISFVTELELLAFPKISDDSEKIIKGILDNCLIIDINQYIKEITIGFRKKTRLKLPDAIVAATSYSLNLPLLTADKQFQTLEEMDIILYEP
jgi:predicted nucleic acid-binding protein